LLDFIQFREISDFSNAVFDVVLISKRLLVAINQKFKTAVPVKALMSFYQQKNAKNRSYQLPEK